MYPPTHTSMSCQANVAVITSTLRCSAKITEENQNKQQFKLSMLKLAGKTRIMECGISAGGRECFDSDVSVRLSRLPQRLSLITMWRLTQKVRGVNLHSINAIVLFSEEHMVSVPSRGVSLAYA